MLSKKEIVIPEKLINLAKKSSLLPSAIICADHEESIISAKKAAPSVETGKVQEKKDENKKNKTVAEIDREKLEKKFSKNKEVKLN